MNYDELLEALRCTENGKDCDSGCPYHNKYTCDPERLMKDAANAIEELQKPRWISVKERLPEVYKTVLTYGKHGVLVDYYSGEKSELGNPLFMIMGAKVTHWMPLPEPPKEDAV